MYICLVPFATKELNFLALSVQLEGPGVIETDPAMCRPQSYNGGQMLLSCERFFTHCGWSQNAGSRILT